MTSSRLGVYVNPDSVLARTAREMVAAHGDGSGAIDGGSTCPRCGAPRPCAVGRAAAEVLSAAGLAAGEVLSTAGLALSSGLVSAARQGLGPDPETEILHPGVPSAGPGTQFMDPAVALGDPLGRFEEPSAPAQEPAGHPSAPAREPVGQAAGPSAPVRGQFSVADLHPPAARPPAIPELGRREPGEFDSASLTPQPETAEGPSVTGWSSGPPEPDPAQRRPALQPPQTVPAGRPPLQPPPFTRPADGPPKAAFSPSAQPLGQPQPDASTPSWEARGADSPPDRAPSGLPPLADVPAAGYRRPGNADVTS